MLAAELVHLAATQGVEHYVDLGLTHLPHVGAGIDDVLAAQHRLAVAIRHEEAAVGLGLVEGQGRGGAYHLFRLLGVVHPGQLDADAVLTLTLDRGLDDAKLVDPFLEDRQVLGHGVVHQQGALRFAQHQLELIAGAGELPLILTGAGALLDDIEPALLPVDVRQGDGQGPLGGAHHAGAAQVGLTEAGAQGIHQVLGLVVDDKVHIDPDQQLGAAAQVQPEFDGIGAELAYPGRGIGVKLQGEGRAVHPLLLQQLLGPLLLGLGGEHQFDPLLLLDLLLGRYLVLLQQALLRLAQAGLAMEAQGGLLTEEGGQGIEGEGEQHQQQQGVLPRAHAVQYGMTLFSHEIGLCQAMARATPGRTVQKNETRQPSRSLKVNSNREKMRQQQAD